MLQDFLKKSETAGCEEINAFADVLWGVALLIRGEIGKGIRWIEQALLRLEERGYRPGADYFRMALCEIYLEIISGNGKASVGVIARNIITLIIIRFTVGKRIHGLIEAVRQNPQFDPNGFHIGRCEMILGLLYKTKKKRALAVQHLTEAKRFLSQFGQTPILARVDAALAELG